MICPKCLIQMHQYVVINEGFVTGQFIGGGFSETNDYLTWELKQCPNCLDLYVELYRTFKLPQEVNPKRVDELNDFIVNKIRNIK